MSGTGIEPMSPAWKAEMLTTTRTARDIVNVVYINNIMKSKQIFPIYCRCNGSNSLKL